MAENLAAAREAGLRYVTDKSPGIRRVQAGHGTRYMSPDGRAVNDPETKARIKRLAIPPAWTEVWISPTENGHIQATGRDARGRKQYRYHSDWVAVRDGAKFERVLAFGHALPRIRKRVARDLRRRKLDQLKVLAAMVRLLETTLVRVGNEEYARQNHSFGLSTMRDRHAKIRSGTLHFEFQGKGGKRHEIDLRDPQLAKIVRQTQELPGQDLFQYLDEDGQPQKIGSADVNAYLRECAGEEFSAEAFSTKAQEKENLVHAIEYVAQRLRNTPAVCKKCYIHPLILDSYLDGVILQQPRAGSKSAPNGGPTELSAEEKAVLKFLERRLPTTAERLAASIKAEKKKRSRRR